MKTPAEIKADAATCMTLPPHAMCDRFDLNKKCKGDCHYVIKELYNLVLQLEDSLAQVERERDALMKDFKTCISKPQKACRLCKNRNKPICSECERWDLFDWIGVCEENTKEG